MKDIMNFGGHTLDKFFSEEDMKENTKKSFE